MKAILSKKLQNYTLLALTGSLLLPTGCKKDEAEPDNPNVEFIDIEDIVVDGSLSASDEDFKNIDINRDGINDFVVYSYNGSYDGETYKYTLIESAEDDGTYGDNKIATRKIVSPFDSEDFYYFALEVGKGQSIKDLDFEKNQAVTSVLYTTYGEKLEDGLQGKGDKYIGVKFKIGSSIHFGWIKVNVDKNITKITIKEVAYNKISGETLKAGEK